MPGQYWRESSSHGEDDYYLENTASIFQIDRRAACRSRRSARTTSTQGAGAAHAAAPAGPERFWASLHCISRARARQRDHRRPAAGGARRDGENLEWFWRQWMYGAGTGVRGDGGVRHGGPEAHPDGQADPGGLGEGRQRGIRFETPAVVRMPVTIRSGPRGDVGAAGRARGPRADDRDRGARGRADDGGVRRRPTPSSRSSRSISRPPGSQPRSGRIATCGNRSGRSSSSPNAHGHGSDRRARLGGQSADYFATRAAAAEALAGFPAAGAERPLAAALRDTSARCGGRCHRARTARGRAPPSSRAPDSTSIRATKCARRRSRLVHADTSARDSAVAWGLATASYQDVIQEAAYRLVARRATRARFPDRGAPPERTFPPTSRALAAGQRPRPRCAPLSTWTTDRLAVRRWVVEAFRFTAAAPLGVRAAGRRGEAQVRGYEERRGSGAAKAPEKSRRPTSSGVRESPRRARRACAATSSTMAGRRGSAPPPRQKSRGCSQAVLITSHRENRNEHDGRDRIPQACRAWMSAAL